MIRESRAGSQPPSGASECECLVLTVCSARILGEFSQFARRGGRPPGRPRIATSPPPSRRATPPPWRSPSGATEDRNGIIGPVPCFVGVVAVALRGDRGSQRAGAHPDPGGPHGGGRPPGRPRIATTRPSAPSSPGTSGGRPPGRPRIATRRWPCAWRTPGRGGRPPGRPRIATCWPSGCMSWTGGGGRPPGRPRIATAGRRTHPPDRPSGGRPPGRPRIATKGSPESASKGWCGGRPPERPRIATTTPSSRATSPTTWRSPSGATEDRNGDRCAYRCVVW